MGIVDRGRLVADGTPEGLKSELRGDAVQVEIGGPREESAVRGAPARLEGIREVVFEGAAVHARARHGASAAPAILSALEQAGIAVMPVRIARPSLDDVYLHYTGRSFQAADERQAEARGGTR